MKSIHRATGIFIAVFVAFHLANHALAWWGIETHLEWMERFRRVYRYPLVEPILLGAFAWQIYSGLRLLLRLWKKSEKTRYEQIQAYSGGLIALFLLSHISAVLGSRWGFGLDTNFYFAARVVVQDPYRYFFAPYYFTGIMAFGIHLANVHRQKIGAIWSPKPAQWHFYIILGVFLLVSLEILYVFMGGRFAIQIPEIYNVF